jgi:hypothetical protein
LQRFWHSLFSRGLSNDVASVFATFSGGAHKAPYFQSFMAWSVQARSFGNYFRKLSTIKISFNVFGMACSGLLQGECQTILLQFSKL